MNGVSGRNLAVALQRLRLRLALAFVVGHRRSGCNRCDRVRGCQCSQAQSYPRVVAVLFDGLQAYGGMPAAAETCAISASQLRKALASVPRFGRQCRAN